MAATSVVYSDYNQGEYEAGTPYWQTREQWHAAPVRHRMGLIARPDGPERQANYPGYRAPAVYRARDTRNSDPNRHARASRVGNYDGRAYTALRAPGVPQQFQPRRLAAGRR